MKAAKLFEDQRRRILEVRLNMEPEIVAAICALNN